MIAERGVNVDRSTQSLTAPSYDVQATILILDHEGIGARIAEKRKLRDLTQQGLALRVPCSKSLISQVERGVKPVTPWLLAAVARELRVKVTELTGQPYRGDTERSDRVHASVPQIRIALNYWDVPPGPDMAPRTLEVLRDDVQAVGGLVDKVDYLKLGERLPGLIEELSAVLHDSSGRARQQAAELLTYTYIAAKAIAYRLGYVDLVSVAIDRAAWAAHATDDPELHALVAEERCQTFFATATHDAGLRYVNQAQRTYGPILASSESGLAITGSLHLRAAIMAARDKTAGDEKRRSTARDHIEQARHIAERIGHDTNHYGLIFGPSNVRIHEVAAAIEMDDADEALRRNDGFKPPSFLPVERSSHHYIDLARGRLMAGQRKQSLDCLLKAERLAPQHTRNHPMARETVTALLRAHKRVPEALRALARRMAIAVPAP
jgi:transcriptional regulator with XRE-family HTH domain